MGEIPERDPIPTSPSQRFALGPSLSALKGGEGIVTFGFQFLADQFEDPGEIAHHVTVPETDHAVSMPSDITGAGCISLFLQCVLAAIELDCELEAGTSEIDDITADRMLPAKTVLTGEFAQSPPKLLLNFGRVPPQLSSNARAPS